MASLLRLEVWSDYEYAGGTRSAIIPLDACTRLVTTERTTRDDEGTIELSKDAPGASSLAARSVVRFVFDDASVTEWRVRTLDDTSRTSRLVRATLQSPLMELHTGAAMITATTSNATTVAVEYKSMSPATIVAAVLAFAPSGWTAGTITPTIACNLLTDAWLPLRALRELVTAIEAQGVSCELDYRRNGSSGYYVDLVTAIGSSATTLDVRTGKNLLSTQRTADGSRYAVETYPLGGTSVITGNRSTIAYAWWECTAKSGTTLTMAAVSTGGAMLAFDDQLNGLYLVDDAGARQLISDSTAGATQTIVVASAANVTVGRLYRVVADSAGRDLVRLRAAEATAGPVEVVESDALTDVANLIKNPAMQAWAGAASVPPDGWTTTSSGAGGALARTTTAGLWVYGGQSCRVYSTNIGSVTLKSPTATWYWPTTHYTSTTRKLTLSAWVYPVTVGGSITLSLIASGSTNTYDLSTYPANTWSRIDLTLTRSAGVDTARAEVTALGTGADVYFDSVQVTLTETAQDFTEGSDACRLWGLGNSWLSSYSTVPTTYRVSFADLGAWDPDGFPYDAVSVGQTASVRDTDLDITTSARVLELTRDWRNPLASEITVATRLPDLVSLLSGLL